MEGATITRDGHRLTATIQGELTLKVTPELKKNLEAALDQDAVQTVTVNLSRVSFMDSTGISFLIALHKRAKTLEKRFEIDAPSEQVAKILNLVQLTSFFNLAEQS